MNGSVKKIMTDRGFGFISRSDNDEDVFFHRSALENDEFDRLREGTQVTFNLENTQKGVQAINIKLEASS